jgi:hypothetical protein
LTKGFLNFKDENKSAREAVREIEEKSLYPGSSPAVITTRYLKVAAQHHELFENIDIEIKTKLVDHHPHEGVLFKQYFKDDDAAAEGDQEQKVLVEKNSNPAKKIKPKS